MFIEGHKPIGSLLLKNTLKFDWLIDWLIDQVKFMLTDNQSFPTPLPQAINNDQFLKSLVDIELQATGVVLEWIQGLAV